ncbi:MAG: hypothetical protein ABIJ97_09110 [Bacteroidota bacterium]
MKTTIYIYPVLICFCLFSSCFSSKEKSNTKSGKTNRNLLQNLIVDAQYNCLEKEKNYTIESANIVDSTISISIKYKGKNENDIFNLYFNGMYAKSLPAIATLCLDQNVIGENEFSRELKFNITKAKYAKGDKTFIMLNGYSEKLILNN